MFKRRRDEPGATETGAELATVTPPAVTQLFPAPPTQTEPADPPAAPNKETNPMARPPFSSSFPPSGGTPSPPPPNAAAPNVAAPGRPLLPSTPPPGSNAAPGGPTPPAPSAAPSPAPQSAPHPQTPGLGQRAQPQERRSLTVGKGISLQGVIQDAEQLVVEGTVEAQLLHGNDLVIAPGGVFKGEVEVDDCSVAGTLDGAVTARTALLVRSTGRVIGTARCRRLQVEDGGQISGRIEMITDTPAPRVGS